MKFNILKTRRGRLQSYIESAFGRNLDVQDIIRLMNLVDVYEKDNLETIEKLKRQRTLELNKINGALKQAINAHGPVTKVLIGSATKRIYGALLDNNKKESTFFEKIVSWLSKSLGNSI